VRGQNVGIVGRRSFFAVAVGIRLVVRLAWLGLRLGLRVRQALGLELKSGRARLVDMRRGFCVAYEHHGLSASKHRGIQERHRYFVAYLGAGSRWRKHNYGNLA